MKSKVYYSKEINPNKLIEMYKLLGKELTGNNKIIFSIILFAFGIITMFMSIVQILKDAKYMMTLRRPSPNTPYLWAVHPPSIWRLCLITSATRWKPIAGKTDWSTRTWYSSEMITGLAATMSRSTYPILAFSPLTITAPLKKKSHIYLNNIRQKRRFL